MLKFYLCLLVFIIYSLRYFDQVMYYNFY